MSSSHQSEWTRILGTSGSDVVNAITTGNDGSIYIAGSTEGDLDGQTHNGSNDAFISKYDSDGTREWTRILGTSGSDVVHAITTGNDGSIYITGYTAGDLDGQTNNSSNDNYFNDAFISKYSSDGTKEWTRLQMPLPLEMMDLFISLVIHQGILMVKPTVRLGFSTRKCLLLNMILTELLNGQDF